MTEIARNALEVGTNGDGEVVINHPDLKPDENGVGHIVFSVDQALNLAYLLESKASDAAKEIEEKRRREAAKIPVDRSCQVLVSGDKVPEDRSHAELKENGQQKDYVVLCNSERAKGFVRPVRRTYKHLKCGTTTTMSRSIAETYARDPFFYSGTFCCHCGTHLPTGEDGEFIWLDDGSKVGT